MPTALASLWHNIGGGTRFGWHTTNVMGRAKALTSDVQLHIWDLGFRAWSGACHRAAQSADPLGTVPE
jgi:hypothetical protein